jgi:hypothetical protein
MCGAQLVKTGLCFSQVFLAPHAVQILAAAHLVVEPGRFVGELAIERKL